MKTNTRELILAYIHKHAPLQASQIASHFWLYPTIIHRHLKQLIHEEKIYKEGTPPKVLYYPRWGVTLKFEKEWDFVRLSATKNGKVLTRSDQTILNAFLTKKWQKHVDIVAQKTVAYIEKLLIESHAKLKPNQLYNTFAYYYITEDPALQKEFTEYTQYAFPSDQKGTKVADNIDISHRIYGVYFNLLQFRTPEMYYNASSKLISLRDEYQANAEKIHINKLYYRGVDKIDDIKTQTYNDILDIKAFQDTTRMRTLYDMVFGNNFRIFLKRQKIDYICIIPNNVTRVRSFNAYIQERLHKDFPKIPHIKLSTNDFVWRKPQKAIRWLSSRIENAEKLFSIQNPSALAKIKSQKNVLVVDDLFGSWATMNSVSKKIKTLLPKANIIWFSIIGSYRAGFDVINEI